MHSYERLIVIDEVTGGFCLNDYCSQLVTLISLTH